MSATESDPDRGPAWPASGVVSPAVADPVSVVSPAVADLPCVASLAVLTAVDPTLIPAADRLELLVELERHAAWLESVRLSVVAAVAGPGPDFSQVDARLVDPGEPLWDVQMAQDTIRDEIAVALRICGRAADRRIGLARDLEHKLTATADLLRAGKCSYQHAAVVSEECVNLSVRDAGAVEDRALGRVEQQTPSHTRRSIRRA
ncbi:MAG: DUF222 domain-containing protein, partial [Candidatus Nanopelagicales bacterium]